MNKTTYTTVERIIAKIDNDFNPNNSDWIPRVGAWCIDAMQQLDVLMTSKVKKKLLVKDRIARSECCLSNLDLTVYDENGCIVPLAGTKTGCCGANNLSRNSKSSSTGNTPIVSNETLYQIQDNSRNGEHGGRDNLHYMRTHRTVELEHHNVEETVDMRAQQINTKGYPARYNVVEIYKGGQNSGRNYVVSGGYTLELNYDADYVFIEYDTVDTVKGMDGVDYPVIPNNGKLIEAIVYYCMYKMLCRGYKHPVFNLQASQYGTNPYYIWTSSKEEAKRSVLNEGVNEDVSKLFRSSLFISTFYPRG